MSHSKKEMISFYLTTRCNLDCIYCYTNKNAAGHRHQTLDFEFARVGIDDYFETAYARHIRFFGGGEPTIELDLIKRILAYAKSKDPGTTAEIQTNGCFSEATAEWLRDSIDIIWISSDGRPELQDYYRPLLGGGRSSPILERNIKFLSPRASGSTGIRMTITAKNFRDQIPSIDYFADMGIRSFWVDPMFPAIGEKETLESLPVDDFAREFVTAVKHASSKHLKYGSILTCNFDESGEYACRALLPVPHLTTDGYVSACDMALFGNDAGTMQVFIYGQWNPRSRLIEYDQEKIAYLRSRTVGNIPKCAKCRIAAFCRGYCPGEVVNETGNLFGCKHQICKPSHYVFDRLTAEEKSYDYSHP